MNDKDIKSRIFGEYIGCQVINNNSEVSILTYSNFESCILGDWKLILDNMYNMNQELIDIITETERYHRRIDALQKSNVRKKVTNESRNNPDDNNSMMISYMRFDPKNPVKREGYAEGISDWFKIKSSLSTTLIKSRGYDLGSHWYKDSKGNEINLIGSEYAIQKEYMSIDNFEEFKTFVTENIDKLSIISNCWADKKDAILDLLLLNNKKRSNLFGNHKEYFEFINNLNLSI